MSRNIYGQGAKISEGCKKRPSIIAKFDESIESKFVNVVEGGTIPGYGWDLMIAVNFMCISSLSVVN